MMKYECCIFLCHNKLYNDAFKYLNIQIHLSTRYVYLKSCLPRWAGMVWSSSAWSSRMYVSRSRIHWSELQSGIIAELSPPLFIQYPWFTLSAPELHVGQPEDGG